MTPLQVAASKSRLILGKVIGTSRADREAELIASLRRAGSPKILLLGDSLVDASRAGGGNPNVARGAYGGSRISDVLAVIGRIKGAFLWHKVAGAVVAVGINDAQTSEGDDLESRRLYFRSALDALSRSLGGKPLILLTIADIASAGEWVTRFNRDLIRMENEDISALTSAKVLDAALLFRQSMQAAGLEYDAGFRDGVHFSQLGYRHWSPLLEQAIGMVSADSLDRLSRS
ncbi:SGNH/GDSL hydrolase family protein [Mesorhizobium sp. f-mel]